VERGRGHLESASGLRGDAARRRKGLRGRVTLRAVEIFDPGTATWTAGGANLGWMSPTVIALREGRVFVSAAFDAVVIFEPRTNVSQITANVHCAGSGYATTLLADGRVLLTGGVVFHDTGWFEPSSGTLASAHLFRP
jgi:hypothetical protein